MMQLEEDLHKARDSAPDPDQLHYQFLENLLEELLHELLSFLFRVFNNI
jgi:hypothetical protein